MRNPRLFVCVCVFICVPLNKDHRELQGDVTLETCSPLNKVKRLKLCQTNKQCVLKHTANYV